MYRYTRDKLHVTRVWMYGDYVFLVLFSSVSDFLMGEQDIGLSEQSMNKHYSQVSDCLKSSGQ